MFINELVFDVINNGSHGVSLSNDVVQLLILLFADDMILLSETVTGLQTQLYSIRSIYENVKARVRCGANCLFRAASTLQLKLNMNKSNIVVFRKGGYLAAIERWFYNDCRMKMLNSYTYLGICFSTKLSFNNTCQDLVTRAKKALLCIMSKL